MPGSPAHTDQELSRFLLVLLSPYQLVSITSTATLTILRFRKQVLQANTCLRNLSSFGFGSAQRQFGLMAAEQLPVLPDIEEVSKVTRYILAILNNTY